MELAKLFSRMFLIFGAILLVIGGGVGLERMIFLSGSVSAQGLVAEVRLEQNAVPMMNQGTGYHFYPTVEFTPDGSAMAVRFESPAGVTGTVFQAGQRVPVRYNPNNPNRAVIDNPMGIFGLAIIFGGLGVLFIVFAGVALKGFDRKKY